MAESNHDHERRIATIEGEMKSLATKADLAEFKAEIMEYVQSAIQSAIRAQTEEFRLTFDKFSETLEKQSGEIRELREKESRFRGAVDTLKYALPFLISIIAVLVAVLK
jgi:predicted  nucleic acid-binding Zn-ribbon protein